MASHSMHSIQGLRFDCSLEDDPRLLKTVGYYNWRFSLLDSNTVYRREPFRTIVLKIKFRQLRCEVSFGAGKLEQPGKSLFTLV